MSMAAIIGINGYEKADFDNLEVKKKICEEIGIEIDSENNILHAENNTMVTIGKLKLEVSGDKVGSTCTLIPDASTKDAVAQDPASDRVVKRKSR